MTATPFTIKNGATITGTVTATAFSGDGSALTGISAGLSNVVEDTTPQLGGNLDTNGNNITNTGSIRIDVSGTIQLDADDSGEVRLLDGGTQYAVIKADDQRLKIQSIIQDKDILIVGNDGGVETTAMSFDMSAGGNAIFNASVGIGADTPSGKLDVRTSSTSGVHMDVDGNNFYMNFKSNSVSDIAQFLVSEASGAGVIGMGVKNTGGTLRERMHIGHDEIQFDTSDASGTAGTDIRIVAGGGTGSLSKLHFTHTTVTDDSAFISTERQGDGSIDMAFATAGNTSIVGSADMTIDGGSSVISGDFNDTSDIALKENITAIPDGAIATIKQLQPKSFTWKTVKDEAQDTDSGFIAQEVEIVLPNDVHGVDGSKGINTLGVVAHLTKALQEAITKIEDLEARVDALESPDSSSV